MDTIFRIGFLPGNYSNCHHKDLQGILWPAWNRRLKQTQKPRVLLQKEACAMPVTNLSSWRVIVQAFHTTWLIHVFSVGISFWSRGSTPFSRDVQVFIQPVDTGSCRPRKAMNEPPNKIHKRIKLDLGGTNQGVYGLPESQMRSMTCMNFIQTGRSFL